MIDLIRARMRRGWDVGAPARSVGENEPDRAPPLLRLVQRIGPRGTTRVDEQHVLLDDDARDGERGAGWRLEAVAAPTRERAPRRTGEAHDCGIEGAVRTVVDVERRAELSRIGEGPGHGQ